MVVGWDGRAGDENVLDKFGMQLALGITPTDEHSDLTMWFLIDEILSDLSETYVDAYQHQDKEALD